jgi:hypothetical protein
MIRPLNRFGLEGDIMIKAGFMLAMAGLVALAVAFAPQPARAGSNGGAVAAGVLGGIAAGAIIAGSQNQGAYPNDYYHPGYHGPSYGAPPHMYSDDCHYERARFWDQYAGIWRMGPPRLVCY